MVRTASTIIPVMIPVLIAKPMCGDPNANSDSDAGFNPFFRCPIYTRKCVTLQNENIIQVKT